MTPHTFITSGVFRAILSGILTFGVAASASAQVQVASTFFQQNCAACHTIGGGALVGPDLKAVTERRERAWVVKFIEDPKAVIDSGDATARALVAAAGGLVMPQVAGMTHETAEALVDLIEVQSRQAQPSLAGPRITTRAFTPADVEQGQLLFNGTRQLQNGGPPCLSCHNVGAAGGFGGGQLGPDLTGAYDRLKGRQGLGVWLSAPATTTMKSIFGARAFTPQEIEAFLAYLEEAAKQPVPTSRPWLAFLLTGSLGAVAGLILLGWVWRGRFRAVRRRLVEAATSGGTR